jgi:putative ubiquitin-RnfH superfamily antitoxin RatB of RatAB toxin-antitoxin module
VTLELPPGATLRNAVVRSGLLERHPEIDLAVQKLGVFGAPAALERPLAEGDRVEIYRELAMDPKEARRRRALGKAQGKR